MLSPMTPQTSPVATGILYLHGFNSAGASPKARLVKAACDALDLPCETPDLPSRAVDALALGESLMSRLGPQPLVMGSSMGGFLATILAERHGLKAVLVNPAVRPARLVDTMLGQSFVNAYTGERFVVEQGHRDQVAQLTPESLTPWRYLLLLVTQDETLNSHDAFEAYRGARAVLHPGGEHGFNALADYLPAVFAHAGHRLEPGVMAPVMD
ncbi:MULTISPECIES: YqiA/YcfP family alpha/beta fold hydrolase [unclassified Halomonas]|uniref:YqiA/YcfP family alpha/beta fold hydrolase n=1 Tax=unclassified Halomonas TaxID=2609666 RepID=UPI001C96A145|nr:MULTISPECIES: YqiA/YcfP family alpha/beta fold hydrolase [unclassified Halomonas]MBY5924392.1 esterase [Halomonas sp. DP4Y7-2]MBY6231434.1 esterase [Halomonas sp. DP4Y7-1]